MVEVIWRGIFSMLADESKIYAVPFGVAEKNYIKIFEYACNTSDSFTIITKQKKPYSSVPVRCIHDDYLHDISTSLCEQVVNAKKWPGTETKANHIVLNRYAINATTIKWLKRVPNLLSIGSGPEDICFYRNGKPWLITTTHEKTMYVVHPTTCDKTFFDNYIRNAGDGSMCSP